MDPRISKIYKWTVADPFVCTSTTTNFHFDVLHRTILKLLYQASTMNKMLMLIYCQLLINGAFETEHRKLLKSEGFQTYFVSGARRNFVLEP